MNSKGQTLVEVLIALGAAVVIISAIAVVVVTSVNNSDFSKNQNLATQYAQQGMEILKQQSHSNWQSFSSYGGTYCLADNSTALSNPGPSGCTLNIKNFFIRQVTINQNDLGCSGYAKVLVNVSWTDGKCTSTGNTYCHNVKLDSCLANINGTQAP